MVLLAAYLRSEERSDRLATRLVLLALAGGLALLLLLGDLPERLAGRALVPSPVLTVVVALAVMAGAAAAVLRYHLDEIEPPVRRGLAQGLVVAMVGGAFLAGVGAVDRASDRTSSRCSPVGSWRCSVLPLALGVQRTLQRLVYGDRDLPRRVVSDLRRLDPDQRARGVAGREPDPAVATAAPLLRSHRGPRRPATWRWAPDAGRR